VKTRINAGDPSKRHVRVMKKLEQFRWTAVHELCAEFYWSFDVRRVEGEYAPADAVAGFEKDDLLPCGGQLAGSGETGDACSDDEHV
jgi:hypothetical protein